MCPSERYKHGGRNITLRKICLGVLLLKRKIVTLELRLIEIHSSSSAGRLLVSKKSSDNSSFDLRGCLLGRNLKA